MRNDKNQAIKLRSSGKSYNEIRSALSVPKSTMSEWFKRFPWSEEIKQRLILRTNDRSRVIMKKLSQVRGKHLRKIYQEAEIEAKDEYDTFKYHPLFVAAVMIYWGEGDKLSKYRVSVTNSDPAVLRTFSFFLKNFCQINDKKIKAWVLAYPDLNIDIVKNYWVKSTGIVRENFSKTMVIKGKLQKRKLSYGVCTVLVTSSYFKRKMLTWLRCFSEDLISDRYYAGMV